MTRQPISILMQVEGRPKAVLVQTLAPRPQDGPITVLEHAGAAGSVHAILTREEAISIKAGLVQIDMEYGKGLE